MAGALTPYRKKRNFRETPEPAGKVSKSAGASFVVQKHDATRLHYDFRLELDGVLLSWAVTRGPSLDPADKRLAVRTEDHPIDYAGFEGVIPTGYGAGTVIVWDRGTWAPEEDPHEGLRKGALKFTLKGQRLKGGWALVRLKPRASERADKENWLLIKREDKHASKTLNAVEEWDDSVKSHRTIDELATKAKDGAEKRRATHGKLTSPDRILWPEAKVTKQDLADYLDAHAERMLPFLKGRPLAIVRCPDGRSGKCFFQKHPGASTPDAVGTVRIREKDGEEADYMVVNDRAGLAGMAQISALELHIWGARQDRLEQPERLVFDLDPDEALPFSDVVRAAEYIRDRLKRAGLQSFPLLTGGKGIHVVAPIARTRSWDDVKTFCHGAALEAAASQPDDFVAQASKAKRKGRIFIDWLRNERGSTAIAPFSPRRRPNAPVATPVSWAELPDIETSAAFTLKTIGARLSKLRADPWKDYAKASRQRLTNAAIAAVSQE
ncbi:MAG: non-homologous end-joining DNA ligase [Hyphomonadaceae bacterium]